MKQNIHPQYYEEATVTCSCGNKFTTGSTLPSISIEICAACHPFFTGEVKYVDLAGRVDKFTAKMQKASQTSKKTKKAATADTETENLSLKEMLKGAKKSIAKAHKSNSEKDSK